jgi:hypothetical protein
LQKLFYFQLEGAFAETHTKTPKFEKCGPMAASEKQIRFLRVYNFKSWGGEHVIGDFKTFTAIIGPNGSGK